MHTVMVLGGYGFFGERISESLASDLSIRLLIAGRDLAKATALAARLKLPASQAMALDANDPNLAAFKAHGGKLIQYHGWNDPGIPPGYSLEYRARLAATMGQDRKSVV